MQMNPLAVVLALAPFALFVVAIAVFLFLKNRRQ